MAQLLDRLDDRFALLAGGDRLAAGRHRSLAATVEWSYQLLDEAERRVFRPVSVFPGPFTLEAAEAVAGPGAGPAVLRLVDCSLLVPPRAGPDGRSRYGMLETLRAYGAGLLAGPGSRTGGGRAGRVGGGVAEQAAAGLRTSAGEAAAARWLDAEDATMGQVLAWAMDHDRTGAAAGGRAGLVVVAAGPAGRPVPAAARGRRARRAGQRRVVRRAVLARLGARSRPIWPGRWGISPRCATRSRTGGRPGAGRRPGRPGGQIVEYGPDRRGGRRCPPCPGRGPGDRLPGRPGAGPGWPGHRRRTPATWTVPCGWPGRPGRSRGRPRRVRPGCGYMLTGALIEAGDLAAAEQRLRGGAGPGPGRGRPDEPGGPAAADGGPGPAGGPPRGRRGAPARSSSRSRADRHVGRRCSTAWTAAGTCAPRPGVPPRPSRCGPLTPRSAARAGSRTARGCAPGGALREARQALGPDAGPGSRGARRGDEPGHRGRVRPDARPPRPAAAPAPRGRGSSAPGNGNWSPWSPRAAPTPRSPPSCTSASAPSARTWTGSGTRPAAAAAPT